MMGVRCYTEYAGCAITAPIPVNFGTAHGRCRPDVGSAKRIDVYGSTGVNRPYLMIWYSQLKMTHLSDILRPKHNFYSLTICS